MSPLADFTPSPNTRYVYVHWFFLLPDFKRERKRERERESSSNVGTLCCIGQSHISTGPRLGLTTSHCGGNQHKFTIVDGKDTFLIQNVLYM